MNSAQAKLFRIDDFLARQGYHAKKVGPKRLVYVSMLAPNGEKTPSFQVTPDGHGFKDWSTGAHGSIIDLAMAILGTHDVSAALAFIEKTMGRPTSAAAHNSSSFVQQKHVIEIAAVSEVSSPALLTYARSRGIPDEITCAYCREVRYRIASSGKEYYSLGFANDAGGWELRNRFAKLAAAPKAVTTVNDRINCTTLVLEGFFDFLSAAALRWFRPAEMNAVVLNSTALLERALPLLGQATRIIMLLDNDAAGRRATSRIAEAFPFAEDYSSLFSMWNDLNEYNMKMNESHINKVDYGRD